MPATAEWEISVNLSSIQVISYLVLSSVSVSGLRLYTCVHLHTTIPSPNIDFYVLKAEASEPAVAPLILVLPSPGLPCFASGVCWKKPTAFHGASSFDSCIHRWIASGYLSDARVGASTSYEWRLKTASFVGWRILWWSLPLLPRAFAPGVGWYLHPQCLSVLSVRHDCVLPARLVRGCSSMNPSSVGI